MTKLKACENCDNWERTDKNTGNCDKPNGEASCMYTYAWETCEDWRVEDDE